ncbi:peptidase S8 [Streptomyces lunaelactis]|uniref:Peptidase S8 n=1 Tax=Streptomyces lunaelactis TaxID=1535768 RepID=A0A2R4T0W9_9ACTN|nr:S8 family serine peptidase [Streptomyces lunaelactis]AVZ72776.1 peptidase S8 [Streptomyces lunaelactis]NUK89304.1 S8 family serine peptidase [Streptomyces lunaelactis]
MRVLIQVHPTPDITAAVIDSPGKQTAADVAGDLAGIDLDSSYLPVAMPKPVPKSGDGDPLSMRQPLDFSWEPVDASVLVRGEISDEESGPRLAALTGQQPNIVGVFADAVIESLPTCPDHPVGTWNDVASVLHVTKLHEQGLDGSSVAVAVVDSGINLVHLGSSGVTAATVDQDRSWSPSSVPHLPGRFPVDHGTMCAFNVLIAAPSAHLLDVPVLLSRRREQTVMEGYLSDAIAAYAHLRSTLELMPENNRSLVVSNSWGPYTPSWDFPPGHPGNYSDSLAHPFNQAVAELANAGADVLFAAGNCGRECPDRQCGYSVRPIVGANSHPQALSIGGVDVAKGGRLGYSSQGPGRLARRKPDLCGYTHFLGSQAYGVGKADTGTSTACPVVAGVVAAVRSAWSAKDLSPEEMRALLQRTAHDPSRRGFSDDYGYGTINVPGLLEALQQLQSI